MRLEASLPDAEMDGSGVNWDRFGPRDRQIELCHFEGISAEFDFGAPAAACNVGPVLREQLPDAVGKMWHSLIFAVLDPASEKKYPAT